MVNSKSENATYKTNVVELSVRTAVLHDLFREKPVCLAAFLSSCNVHLSVCKHGTRGWID